MFYFIIFLKLIFDFSSALILEKNECIDLQHGDECVFEIKYALNSNDSVTEIEWYKMSGENITFKIKMPERQTEFYQNITTEIFTAQITAELKENPFSVYTSFKIKSNKDISGTYVCHFIPTNVNISMLYRLKNGVHIYFYPEPIYIDYDSPEMYVIFAAWCVLVMLFFLFCLYLIG
ncbi:hypothetical protein MRV_0016 [Murid herpesvirus 3]|uniref:Uncharacterized protein n=2 Tax=Murid betaherpesvirus 3 TaxID=2560603 RepID=A0A1P8VIS2_9BETA|nr:hypothetical protein MRV_0016 [Murine roseolovirus]APZ76227.1 hypothetical protein MRV_0016 [Murid betaherpesvirus 3]AYH64794.1 hypothetical protein MRV_0016 [Murid herpesvirus 3]